MSDSDRPPPDSVPPPSPHEGRERKRRLEGVIPEIVRRAVELGVEKARESPDNLKQFVGDLKVPKEIAHYLLQQIDETKNGLFRVVGKEVRDFLEHTNFAGEMQKLLTTVQFEVNTTIRFTPNDGRKGKKAEESEAHAEGEGEDEEQTPSEPPTSAAEDEEGGAIPKPELKTAVHVRRDGRDDRERRKRGARGT